MLARGSVVAQQPSPSSNDDDLMGGGPDGDDDDDDDDGASDGNSESEYTGSAGLRQPHGPSGTSVTQQEPSVVSEPGTDSLSITRFQQARGLMEMPQDSGSIIDPSWTGFAGQAQTYRELTTPGSNALSWFDPLEVSTSTTAGSQPSWWTKSPVDEHRFHNSEPFDIGLFGMPGSNDDLKGRGHVESSGRSNTWDNDRKGSVTLTLSQVDPDVAQEIMGSLLKHSAALKIRCIVNDD